MEIKKNFFAPLASGLGATRRAAMLLLVMMLTTATAWAQSESGSCGGNLTWEFMAGTLTISGEGAMYDYDPDINPAPWNSYAEQINEVVIEKDVTSIGAYAFIGTGLTSVSFAAGSQLTSIGAYAFFECTNLESVTFAEGSQLESIGDYAFQNCSNLTSITIPASVTSIGENVFLNCDLASITVEDDNTVFDSCNGCNAIIVKSTNTLIIGCKNSTIPAGVTSIGMRAFYTTRLTSIEIPASVTSIGKRAFQNCPNLATVTVYAPSCSLGEDAFANCDELANIYVFSDKVASYKAATNWSTYAGKITAIPTVTTSYVDADGTLHENVEAVPLNNAMTTLSAGWYVVNSDINYTGTITLNGDVNIILADGKTMTVNSPNDGIYGKGSGPLTIYGQTLGTGTLSATASKSCIYHKYGNIVIRGGTVNATGTGTNSAGIDATGSVTITGGTVNATATSGAIAAAFGNVTITGGKVTATGNVAGIYSSDGNITLTGGQVTATGGEAGIYSDNDNITLGWTSASDFIKASSYYLYNSNSSVKIASGKTLSDGTNTYDNQTASATLLALTNVTLTPPTYSVTANRVTTQDTEYWSTFYHPAAGYTADENTTVYQAAVNTTTNNVELTAVPGREIPADKAVVLKSTQSAITLSRATTTQTLDGNELKGGSTVADGTVPYTLAAKDGTVGFYKFVGAALNPNKAHLEITAPAQSAPAFFGFEENTTAINEHELHESHELSGAWYTLDGRKLSGKPSAKGIYVRNGRKFIIK